MAGTETPRLLCTFATAVARENEQRIRPEPIPSPRVGLIQREHHMLKLLFWAVGIIFVIGLLVVFGVIDLIF